MPIPISVTNPQGKGLVAANPAELPTSGPFARMAASSTTATTSTAAAAHPNGAASAPQPVVDIPPHHPDAFVTNHLTFSYPDIDGKPLPNRPPVVRDMSVSLPTGSRCLLVGPNGAGKTTLLKVIAGKHMVPRDSVKVLGDPPFYATHLTTSGALSYIGGNWERDIAFAGYSIPLAGDIPAGKMLAGIPGIDPARRQRLIDVLDIDVDWKMHLVSDGQRRRVQLAMGLLKPFTVLLLDEITVDLDVLGRADLMKFLKEECDERGATIIYATHIFDGLDSWPTHILYVAGGEVRCFESAANLPELQQEQLLELVEKWLRAELAERRAAAKAAPIPASYEDAGSEMAGVAWNNGWGAGRLQSTMQHGANTVLRM